MSTFTEYKLERNIGDYKLTLHYMTLYDGTHASLCILLAGHTNLYNTAVNVNLVNTPANAKAWLDGIDEEDFLRQFEQVAFLFSRGLT